MLIVIDNGNASEIIKNLRMTAQIKKPADALKTDCLGFIISDGILNNTLKKTIEDFVKTTKKPVLGIGLGGAYVASAFGAKILESKPAKNVRTKIVKASPTLLNLKSSFNVVSESKYTIDNLPENFDVVAQSPTCEYEVIQHRENPLFAVHFNPELGLDGKKILDNFVEFIKVWDKYHK